MRTLFLALLWGRALVPDIVFLVLKKKEKKKMWQTSMNNSKHRVCSHYSLHAASFSPAHRWLTPVHNLSQARFQFPHITLPGQVLLLMLCPLFSPRHSLLLAALPFTQTDKEASNSSAGEYQRPIALISGTSLQIVPDNVQDGICNHKGPITVNSS